MPVLQKQRAFTFIELLIVVTIISLMSAALVVDFRGARESQDLSSATDQALALLQQSQLEVRSGMVELDEDLEEGDEESILQTWMCRGALFQIGTLPLSAQGEFSLDDKTCQEPETESYGIGADTIEVDSLRVGESEYDSVAILYEPPNGDVTLWGRSSDANSDFQALNGDFYVRFAHVQNADLSLDLFVDYLTANAKIVSDKDKEDEK